MGGGDVCLLVAYVYFQQRHQLHEQRVFCFQPLLTHLWKLKSTCCWQVKNDGPNWQSSPFGNTGGNATSMPASNCSGGGLGKAVNRQLSFLAEGTSQEAQLAVIVAGNLIHYTGVWLVYFWRGTLRCLVTVTVTARQWLPSLSPCVAQQWIQGRHIFGSVCCDYMGRWELNRWQSLKTNMKVGWGAGNLVAGKSTRHCWRFFM